MLRFLTRHRTAGNLLMLAFLALGVYAISGTKRESFPDFSMDALRITAKYAGATAEEVEEAMGVPIEEALESVSNIKNVTVSSMEGLVSVVVEMVEGSDWQTFYNDVKSEVESINTFPSEYEDLIIKPLNLTDHVVSVAVYSDMSPQHLKEYSERLKDKILAAAPGAQVEIGGFSQREFRIELRPAALRTYNLSVVDIANLIKSQNTDLPAGTLQTGEQDIKLRFSDRRKSVEELAGIRVLSSASGTELTLGDIATITDRFKLDEQMILFNGQRAGMLAVSKSKAADALTIFAQVKAVVDKERTNAPKGLHFGVTRNNASIVQDRLSMLYGNAYEGFALVFIVLWVFLNIKLSFWVALGLPISFLGGLFFMRWFGISLNMMSMFALLISLGLLMDDAIVLAENVAAHLAMGENHIDAAVNGVAEVGVGVFSSFITTACIFAPLMFLSGVMGKILWVIPATLIIVLTVSLFEAFFILPGQLAYSFKNGLPVPGRARQAVDRAMDYLRNTVVGGTVRRLLPQRYVLLAAVLVVFVGTVSLFLSGHVKFTVFPSVDSDTAIVKVQMPPGTPFTASEAAALKLYEGAKRANTRLKGNQPGGRDLFEAVSVYYSTNSDVQDTGPHLFTVYADLLPGDQRSSTMAEILATWREETEDISGAMRIQYEDMTIGPGGKPVEIRLSGYDLDELKSVSEELQGLLANFSGVLDIMDDLTPGKPEVVMSMKPGALRLGLKSTDIARQLRAAYHGEKADELQIGTENYEYNVRLLDSLDSNQTNFDDFLLTVNGRSLRLNQVVDMENRRSPSIIKRHNGRRTVTITAELDTERANAFEITAEVERYFRGGPALKNPDLGLEFGGQREAGGETGGSILWAFLIGVLGIFILLSLQFETYLEPIVIMATIPLAIIGSIWGHVFLGLDFTMQSLLGVVSIAGVVVNNSILMLEFIKLRERRGHSSREAAEMAASDRFRAIMLTSLTTIAGLLPLLLEKSLQAQMLKGMAVSLVFGLMTSTVLVLFVTPTMYAAVLDYREWLGRKSQLPGDRRRDGR